MPPRCTICKHKRTSEINKAIADGQSYRAIALRFGFSHTSVQRHIENCLELEFGVIVQEAKTEQSFDFANELHSLYGRSLKMFDAFDRWLRDPDNPDEYNIDPRDDEMTIVYLDHTDHDQHGNPKQKKDTLRRLLREINANLDKEGIQVMSKAVDNRKLYLDTFKTITDRLEQMAKFYGLFKKDAENPHTISEVAYTAKHERLRALEDNRIHEITSKCEHCSPYNLGAPLDETAWERQLDSFSAKYKVDREAVRAAVQVDVEQSLGRID